MTKQKTELAIDAEIFIAGFESNKSSSNETYLGKIIREISAIVQIEELQNGNISLSLADEMFEVPGTMDSSLLILNQAIISGLKNRYIVSFKGKCDGMLSDFVLK